MIHSTLCSDHLLPSQMLILSANPNLLSSSDPPSFSIFSHRPHASPRRRLLFAPAASSSSVQNPSALRHVAEDATRGFSGEALLSSACAVASAVSSASTSPVEFTQRIEKDPKSGLVLPSSDFQRLCVEQLDLFRRIVDPQALLSVYVRPAGSYVMDRLELRRVTAFPGVDAGDVVILVGSFSIPAGLRAAEAVLANKQVEFAPKSRAAVFPMVKHPFVVGFLVAEFQSMDMPTQEDLPSQVYDSPRKVHPLPLDSGVKSWDLQTLEREPSRTHSFTAEQRLNAINISRSLAMAYVMDQKAMLLQQSSWQNNVRMSNLVEQIRGPLSSIQALGKMLSRQTKKGEISYDIVEDIMVQGDHLRDTLEQLQDAVYLTKEVSEIPKTQAGKKTKIPFIDIIEQKFHDDTNNGRLNDLLALPLMGNIVRCNEETLKKMPDSTFADPELPRPHWSNDFTVDGYSSNFQTQGDPMSLNMSALDLEMPMPPPALAPLRQHETSVSTVLTDLVEAVMPLAHKQNRLIKLSDLGKSLQVSIEEPALCQALSNLIEGALLRTQVRGKVEILCTSAPAGGALVIIDDDGPDMHYMTQMHSLTPFGADLSSENMLEDNMTWHFVAGMTVAREILESYGCVVRVISPRIKDAALGAGGTRVELWLPCAPSLPDSETPAQTL